MALWMLLSMLSAAAFSVVGLLAERASALCERPTRWTWLVVMAASAVWPFVPRGWPHGRPSMDPVSAVVAVTGAGAGTTTSTWQDAVRAVPDSLVLWAWYVASALLIVVLLLSAETLKQDRRRWSLATVARERVYVSAWLGPAVVGMLEARIVLPRWVLDLEARVQEMVVLHEREHVRAGDNRLLVAALLLIVYMPWCLPLWWQFHRLRAAIETDCDRRILTGGARPLDYARALVAVADRRRLSLLPLSAMHAPRSALEQRIRRILEVAPSSRRRAAFGLLAAAAVVCVGAVSLPRSAPPTFRSLTASLLPAPTATARSGSLPGDPGEERLAMELQRHHADAIATGVPRGSVIWFIADGSGDVAYTGIERGTEREVRALLRERYSSMTSDYSFGWLRGSSAADATPVIWMLPSRR